MYTHRATSLQDNSSSNWILKTQSSTRDIENAWLSEPRGSENDAHVVSRMHLARVSSHESRHKRKFETQPNVAESLLEVGFRRVQSAFEIGGLELTFSRWAFGTSTSSKTRKGLLAGSLFGRSFWRRGWGRRGNMGSWKWALFFLGLAPLLGVKTKHAILKIRKSCTTPDGWTKNACCLKHWLYEDVLHYPKNKCACRKKTLKKRALLTLTLFFSTICGTSTKMGPRARFHSPRLHCERLRHTSSDTVWVVSCVLRNGA